MANLIIRFDTLIGGGGVITFKGTKADQGVHWELYAKETLTGVLYAACGSLAENLTKTDDSKHSVNVYVAPTATPLKRFGTGQLFGDGVVFSDPWTTGVDLVKVSWVA